MAIIIEEEKKKSNILEILGWLVVVVILIAAAYYVFFASPPAAIILPSTNLKNIGPLSQVSLNVQSIVSSPQFQALKQYVPLPTSTGPSLVGRANPFISP